jgi:hypothetical protein
MRLLWSPSAGQRLAPSKEGQLPAFAGPWCARPELSQARVALSEAATLPQAEFLDTHAAAVCQARRRCGCRATGFFRHRTVADLTANPERVQWVA